MLISVLLSAVLLQAPERPPVAYCDLARNAPLTQGVREFEGENSGWRQWGEHGCELAAADLIAAYVLRNTNTLKSSERAELLFHEAQLRATSGYNVSAARLIEKIDSRSLIEPVTLYHQATYYFLVGDLDHLRSIRSQLSDLPVPDEFERAREDYISRYGGDGPKWPLNIDIVDDLIKCFGQPYKVAYDCSYH